MAKKKAKTFDPADYGNLMAMNAAREEHGSSGKLGSSRYCSLGIPIPLALQYFLDSNCLPLGMILQLIGEKGQRKTTFALELMRMIYEYNGYGHYVLTENKFSDSLAGAICGYEDEPGSAIFKVVQSQDMNAWQVSTNRLIDQAGTVVDKGALIRMPDDSQIKIPPGGYGPWLLLVDSLVAQQTNSQLSTISNEGGKDRGYATHVKALGDWIGYVKSRFVGRPFLGCFINHCSVTPNPSGYGVQIESKGGTKLSYLSSLVIFVQSTAPQVIRSDDPNIASEMVRVNVNFTITKSSIGSDFRKLSVPVLSWKEINHETGEVRPRMKFMWGEALLNILLPYMYAAEESSSPMQLKGQMDTESARTRFREAIFDVVKFKRVERSKTLFQAPSISDDPIEANELGLALQNNEQFVGVFHKLFGIYNSRVWELGQSFNEAIAAAREAQDNNSILFSR